MAVPSRSLAFASNPSAPAAGGAPEGEGEADGAGAERGAVVAEGAALPEGVGVDLLQAEKRSSASESGRRGMRCLDSKGAQGQTIIQTSHQTPKRWPLAQFQSATQTGIIVANVAARLSTTAFSRTSVASRASARSAIP